jgi:hypothetical protein
VPLGACTFSDSFLRWSGGRRRHLGLKLVLGGIDQHLVTVPVPKVMDLLDGIRARPGIAHQQVLLITIGTKDRYSNRQRLPWVLTRLRPLYVEQSFGIGNLRLCGLIAR